MSSRPIMRLRQADGEPDLDGCEALVAAAQAGDRHASDEICARWLPWLQMQSRSYAKKSGRLDLIEDLQQSAICGSGKSVSGLLQAISRFNHAGGSKFKTYAIYWVNAAMHECLGQNRSTTTRGVAQVDSAIQDIASGLRQYLGRDATADEINAASNLVPMSSERITRALAEKVESMNDPSIASNYEVYTATVQEPTQEVAAMLREALEHLTPKQRRVMQLIHEDGMTFEEAGKVMGVTFQRIAQLNQQALRDLRKADKMSLRQLKMTVRKDDE